MNKEKIENFSDQSKNIEENFDQVNLIKIFINIFGIDQKNYQFFLIIDAFCRLINDHTISMALPCS